MAADAPPSTGLVLLAAGASRRLGQPKQLVAVSDVPLLLRAVDAALGCSAVWPVIVVLGAHADQLRPVVARRPVLVAENPAWAEGIASSLRAGLAGLQQFSRHLEGAVFALCDQPAFSTSVIERLLAHRAATGAGVVAARYAGHAGAPAFIAREHFAALSHLTGDAGARQLFAMLPPDAITTVDLPDLALDLDTPEDLAAWRGR